MNLQTKRNEVISLVEELNRHRHLYYNDAAPEISDAEYDAKFDRLAVLEKETGLIMSTSPTQSVGAPVVSSLEKISHPIPLLSLHKTKSYDDLFKFVGGRPALLMLKIDGLTVKLEYEHGELVRASTRGNGDEGEIITHNARMFKNIPLTIPYKGRVVVTGEANIRDDDFLRLQATIVGSDGKPPKNARNLAAGSVRQLDASESAKRCVRFLAFSVLEGLEGFEMMDSETGAPVLTDTNSKSSLMNALQGLGFETAFAHRLNMGRRSPDGEVTLGQIKKPSDLEFYATQMRAYAAELGIPIDGLVLTFDDVAYSKSLGRTGHHYRDGLAFKFEDESEETVLRKVEWNITRSGELAPVAVFDTIELDGTDVSRATLHNLDFINELNLQIGDRILVSKRNMIIPHIEHNLDKGADRWANGSVYPDCCPACGSEVNVCVSVAAITGATTQTLCCSNKECKGRKLRQLVHFTSKKAMDIDGMSEGTIAKLMGAGLLESELDVYSLYKHEQAICRLEGFGSRAFEKLASAIEKSRNTTMEKFIISMDIPDLGRHASAILCKAFKYDIDAIMAAACSGYDFTVLEDFGDTLNKNIYVWFCQPANVSKWEQVLAQVSIQIPATTTATVDNSNPFFEKTIVATGSFEHFTRDSINDAIAALGAKAGSSVSKKTDFVIAGEKAGSKKAKAEELGVRVLSEAEFIKMAGM